MVHSHDDHVVKRGDSEGYGKSSKNSPSPRVERRSLADTNIALKQSNDLSNAGSSSIGYGFEGGLG